MKILLQIRYEAKDADTLYTFNEKNYPALIAGGEADGFTVEGTWVAVETGLAFIVIDVKDSVKVYEMCEQVTFSNGSTKIRAIPIIPAKKLRQIPG